VRLPDDLHARALVIGALHLEMPAVGAGLLERGEPVVLERRIDGCAHHVQPRLRLDGRAVGIAGVGEALSVHPVRPALVELGRVRLEDPLGLERPRDLLDEGVVEVERLERHQRGRLRAGGQEQRGTEEGDQGAERSAGGSAVRHVVRAMRGHGQHPSGDGRSAEWFFP